MPEVKPRVTLINHTPEPERLVATAARLCYSPDDIAAIHNHFRGLTKLMEPAPADHMRDPAKMVRQITNLGHLSPLEHTTFTFGIEGVSRSLLAQITRHRIASFSVQSQRYVEYGGELEYIVPPDIADNPEHAAAYHNLMATLKDTYDGMLASGIEAEDARFVLPNAAATRMVVTMNARELLHFFSLRCCNRAQWEIRAVAWSMLEAVRAVAPTIFKDAGPGCVRGQCSEGKMSCGRPYHAKD